MDISEARLGPAAAESVGERARRAAKQLLQRRRGRVERALRDTGIGLGEERRQPLGRAGLEQCLAVVPDGRSRYTTVVPVASPIAAARSAYDDDGPPSS